MRLLGLITAVILFSLPGCTSPQAIPERTTPSLGAPKKDGGLFLRKHESFLQRDRSGPVDLLFLGDSITEGWTKAPTVWREYYAAYQSANFGIGGDRAEHVLWRIDNGELGHIRPKVVVLMIGTNNSASQSSAQIAALNRQIIGLIQQKSPQTRVLLLAVFPRGPRKNADGSWDDGVKRMQVITALNAELTRLDDGQRVRFLDIGTQFLTNGRIPAELMPDQLHPNANGYRIWAAAMQPLLAEMMAQSKSKPSH